MTPGERFKKWIDDTAQAWNKRLKVWMASWLGFGIEVFFNALGKAAAPKLKPLIDMLESTDEVPPELQPILDELKSPTGEVAAMFANSAGNAAMGGAISRVLDPLLNPLAYLLNSRFRNQQLAQAQYLALWLRGVITPESLTTELAYQGQGPGRVEWLKELTQIRLDPMSVITAWRRDPKKYEKLFKDLKDMGWDDERIEALKFATLFYPMPQDLVRWQAREVFEPKMIDKYGLDDEYEEIEKEPFYKAGMTDEQILNYWRAHWEHPELRTIVEMLRRTDFSEKDMWDWFRLVEIPPFWRDKLIAISYEVPTRVDVRRFWDMRTIDEARLREIYAQQGYHGKDLDDYVLWTKVYCAFPDLVARWKNGWITESDVRSELTGLGMPATRVEEMIQTKIKPAQPERVEEGKALTKTEIYKGVKQGFITREEGIELLMDLNYNRVEAEYLMDINVAALTGSPETFAEFKDFTQKWRRSVGKEATLVPEDLKQAATDVVRITKELEELSRAIKEEERTLVGEEILPKEATERLTSLQVTLHRAEATLAEARSRYDQQLAIFRHAPPPPRGS